MKRRTRGSISDIYVSHRETLPIFASIEKTAQDLNLSIHKTCTVLGFSFDHYQSLKERYQAKSSAKSSE